MIDWTAIGALILRARESKGWSQADLGRRAGLTGSVVGYIERAERESYQPETIERIAAALGLSFVFEVREAVTSEDASAAAARRELEELGAGCHRPVRRPRRRGDGGRAAFGWAWGHGNTVLRGARVHLYDRTEVVRATRNQQRGVAARGAVR